MLKKLFKLTTVFAILLVAYQGYSRGFDYVAQRLTSARKVRDLPFVRQTPQSQLEAIRYAREAFGPHHWTAADDLGLRYYVGARGFWMYAQHYKRVMEENGVKYNGKRIDLTPIAIILKTADGRTTKTVIADHARLDLSQPLGLNPKSDSEPLVVKFARLEGNVFIRDDKGTPENLADDLVIGPLTHVEYDDDKLEVTSQSDVLIVDGGTRVTGEGGPDGGLKILLRPKASAPQATTRTSGFDGAQKATLYKKPHVVFTDVGKAGVLPGAPEVKKDGSGKVEATVKVDPSKAAAGAKAGPGTKGDGKAAGEPTPLDVRADGPMQVEFPRPVAPVKVGPPAPPGPTLVNFTRNVVVCRGKLDSTPGPDRLDADSLDLVLVQPDRPSPPDRPADAAKPGAVKPAGAAPMPADAGAVAASKPAGDAAAQGEEKGLFGDLTLRRVKATGHAVWLYLPSQGAKIRCNELIHKVAMPDQEGLTYFRGDTPTRAGGSPGTPKLEVTKIDYAEERPQGADGPVKRTPVSVTRIWAVDATLIDNGSGSMETANLFAHGPGYLETRPIPAPGKAPAKDAPPDRTMSWQDSLEIKNLLGPDKLIARREIIVKGRPHIVDSLRQSSLDAHDVVVATLVPRPADPAAAAGAKGGASPAGSFRIKHLLAQGNARLIAPSRYLTARRRLDVDFDELARPTVSTDRGGPTPPSGGSAPPSSAAPRDTIVADAGKQPAGDGPANGGQSAASKKAEEPPMTAIADVVEAKVLLDPDAPSDPSRPGPSGTSKAAGRATAGTGTATAALRTPGASGGGAGQDIRDVRMFGGVRLHQDPAPGKVKASDARGECLVLRNEGPGRAIFNLYHEDPRLPKEQRFPAVVRPRALVITEDMTVEGNTIGVNQITDQAWVYGAGKLIQLTDRGMLTDRNDPAEGEDAPRDKPAAPKKPKMRAGKVQSDKIPLIITWGDRMFFEGRSIDQENRPAARATFFKDVRALMEDGELRCDKVMTTYTDRPVPLADLGNLKKKPSDGAAARGQGPDGEQAAGAEAERPKPDLAFIDMVGKAVAVSRKVDENRPVLLNRQKITGDRIIYDRRTGDFEVPGAGVVYLHERGNQSVLRPEGGGVVAGGHEVRPIADRAGGARPSGARPAQARGAKPAADAGGAIPPLVLTQIAFSREMKGRFGTGKADDQAATRHAEFFGDIQAARAEVRSEAIPLDFDRLPGDAYFLTSQTMRVVTEPPPPGSPRNAPARNFLKAWENAYARSTDSTVQADVITYDSQNDLIYATGEDGRQVIAMRQVGPGQPGSPMRARALRVNPKTGDAEVIGPQDMVLLDNKTGSRPAPVAPPDPNAKPGKPRKPGYKLPQSNYERKGFTGR
ncbi:hypothetical protein OJF2_05090 [Aquisphaera giovannonii]|uniref:Uncharacterized protein n=1 Tax=Aquisphaera giovannonii TaxID=406548 RepID=A0A5B9VWF3_9BACT|nr:hypothetical protein [Aquisphaera giovannonii]QEH32040.1 hypothetical protein OJF2_05090 [Aquisphaera giovannonii]